MISIILEETDIYKNKIGADDGKVEIVTLETMKAQVMGKL
jgi:hypothetical protein